MSAYTLQLEDLCLTKNRKHRQQNHQVKSKYKIESVNTRKSKILGNILNTKIKS